MKRHIIGIVGVAVSAGLLPVGSRVLADTIIITFDDFTSNALYGSWLTGTVESGPESYSISAVGYGSNWKYQPVDGGDNTTVELTVTLSGPPEANAHLGPIVTLEDADGTSWNYAWYGQPLGDRLLKKPVASPTWKGAAGTIPGLDLTTLTHFHLQLDPGGFGTAGSYTVEWRNLSLTGGTTPSIRIVSQTYDDSTGEMTLTWTSKPDVTYAIIETSELTTRFGDLLAGIPSDGDTTTATVNMPPGETGFLGIEAR